jgi:myo-inositol 2-dehydrogenase / D-chiro-inositol 1-dehydrogenase
VNRTTGRPLRVGLVGAGRWAAAHRATLAAAGAELVGVVTGTAEGARRAAAAWDVSATTDLDALLAGPAEAIIVASPNDQHAPQALRALAAGKHVLVEKPMAITLADADRLVAAARSSDRVVAVGHVMRCFGWLDAARDLIDSGAIGRPRHLRLDLWRRPYRTGAGGWKTDPARLGSSVLEEPIHYLDLAAWLLGPPSTLLAWASSRPGREALHEDLDVRLGWPDGHWATLTRSIAADGFAIDLRLSGDEGALRAWWRGTHDADPHPEVGLVLHDAAGTRTVPVPAATGHAHDMVRQTRAFVAAVRTGTPPPADAEAGREAVRLSLAVETSLERGEAVPV